MLRINSLYCDYLVRKPPRCAIETNLCTEIDTAAAWLDLLQRLKPAVDAAHVA